MAKRWNAYLDSDTGVVIYIERPHGLWVKYKDYTADVYRLGDIIEKLLDAPYGTPDADDAREAARAELRGEGE